MLGLRSYAYDYDDAYVAGLTSFLCFNFCFVLMFMLKASFHLGKFASGKVWTGKFSLS